MYFTYILRCEDNSLYTGIAADVRRRMSQHFGRTAQCAKYTRSRRAVSLEAVWESKDRSTASKLEYRIKKLARSDKQRLIDENALQLIKKTDVSLYRRLSDEELGKLI